MHPYVDVLKIDLPRFGAPTPSSDMSRSSPLFEIGTVAPSHKSRVVTTFQLSITETF